MPFDLLIASWAFYYTYECGYVMSGSVNLFSDVILLRRSVVAGSDVYLFLPGPRLSSQRPSSGSWRVNKKSVLSPARLSLPRPFVLPATSSTRPLTRIRRIESLVTTQRAFFPWHFRLQARASAPSRTAPLPVPVDLSRPVAATLFRRGCHSADVDGFTARGEAVSRVFWARRDLLRFRTLTVLSDNSSVCAFIRSQGVAQSREMSSRSVDLLQLTAHPPFPTHQRSPSWDGVRVDWGRPLRLSPSGRHPQHHRQATSVRLPDDPSRPATVEPSVVLLSSPSAPSTAPAPTPLSRPRAARNRLPTPGCIRPQPPCLPSARRTLRARGFSQSVVDRLFTTRHLPP